MGHTFFSREGINFSREDRLFWLSGSAAIALIPLAPSVALARLFCFADPCYYSNQHCIKCDQAYFSSDPSCWAVTVNFSTWQPKPTVRRQASRSLFPRPYFSALLIVTTGGSPWLHLWHRQDFSTFPITAIATITVQNVTNSLDRARLSYLELSLIWVLKYFIASLLSSYQGSFRHE